MFPSRTDPTWPDRFGSVGTIPVHLGHITSVITSLWILRNSRSRRVSNTPRSPSLYGANISQMFLPRSYGQCVHCKIISSPLVSKHLWTDKILWPRFMEVLLGYQIPRFGEQICIPSLKDNRSLSVWSSFEKGRVLLNSNLLKIR
jgi:hypothetical protein